MRNATSKLASKASAARVVSTDDSYLDSLVTQLTAVSGNAKLASESTPTNSVEDRLRSKLESIKEASKADTESEKIAHLIEATSGLSVDGDLVGGGDDRDPVTILIAGMKGGLRGKNS